MSQKLSYYTNINYKVEVVEDKTEGGFALICPELKGCMTCADTIQEGFKMIEDAKMAWFVACIEDGILIPEPTEAACR